MKKYALLLSLAAVMSFSAKAQQKKDNFRGTITNNTADSIVVSSLFGKFRLAMPIDKQGRFSGHIQQGAYLFNLQYADVETGIYLSNETDLVLTANGADFKRTLSFKGEGEVENQLMRKMDNEATDFETAAAKTTDEVALKASADALTKSWSKAISEAKLPFTKQGAIRVMESLCKERLKSEINRIENIKKFKDKPSPQFSYKDVNDKTVNLSDFKGKYVYIDVWATWCKPCREEIPYLQKLEEDLKGKNIAFISLSIDKLSDTEKWKKLVADKKLGGTQLIAENEWKSTFVKAYNIESIPRFILIAPNGNIVDPDARRPSQPELKDQLIKLLN